jgi:hypothetical protein
MIRKSGYRFSEKIMLKPKDIATRSRIRPFMAERQSGLSVTVISKNACLPNPCQQ